VGRALMGCRRTSPRFDVEPEVRTRGARPFGVAKEALFSFCRLICDHEGEELMQGCGLYFVIDLGWRGRGREEAPTRGRGLAGGRAVERSAEQGRKGATLWIYEV
jgi:hypothetical protein